MQGERTGRHNVPSTNQQPQSSRRVFGRGQKLRWSPPPPAVAKTPSQNQPGNRSCQEVNDCEAISPSRKGHEEGQSQSTDRPCRMERAEAGEGTSLGTRSNGSHPAIPLTPDTWAVSRPTGIIYFKCIMCYIDFKRYKWDFVIY